MSLKDGIIKEIDRLDRIAKFYQTIILALSTAIIGTTFSMVIKKLPYITILFIILGIITLVYFSLLLIWIDKEQRNLINKLKDL